MRASTSLLPLLAVLGLAGCGGGETTTETVTVTRAVTVTAPAEQAAAPTDTAAAPAEVAAPPDGLGAGQIALIGTFDMRVTDTGQGGLNASGASQGQEEEWRLRTTCSGDDCAVQVRRRLESGGLEVVDLEPKEGTPDQWFGEFRSKGECGPKSDIPTDATLTLRGLQAQDRVATKLEAYWRAEDVECVNRKGGVARYSGTLR